jgi:hypothetical protein
VSAGSGVGSPYTSHEYPAQSYDGPLTRRIRKFVSGNPKGGAARLRFDQYRDDMTVADYISA